MVLLKKKKKKKNNLSRSDKKVPYQQSSLAEVSGPLGYISDQWDNSARGIDNHVRCLAGSFETQMNEAYSL